MFAQCTAYSESRVFSSTHSEIIHLLSDRKSNVNRVLCNVTGKAKAGKTKGSPQQKRGLQFVIWLGSFALSMIYKDV